jgi:putative CocE/NonD family hydrolase
MDPEFEYEYVIKETLMVSMRDGIRLSTDLHFPSKDGKTKTEGTFPTLLQRTPYFRASDENTRDATYFAKRGYVVVIQDVRGLFGSEGRLVSYDGNGVQGPDGYDTVEWIADQSWSNGKVGTWGFSYPGNMAYALLCFAPPHLTSFLACASGTNYWRQGIRHHGAFEMRYFHGSFAAVGRKENDPYGGTKGFDQWLDEWPISRGASSLGKGAEEWYFTIATESDWPGSDNFWARPGHRPELYYTDMPDIPMLHYTAWYDTYIGSQDHFFTELSRLKKNPQKMILSPRVHTKDFQLTISGDIDFGPDLTEDYREFILRWHDQWIRGLDTGIKDEPPVTLFIMGTGSGRKTVEGHLDIGGYWRFEKEWPLKRTQYRKFFLHGDGTLGIIPPEIEKDCSIYQYDPNKPVPTIGGNISAFGDWLLPGGFNQVVTDDVPIYVRGERILGPLSERDDILVFQTPPLEEDMEVTGPISVRIWISSDCPDTDFTGKLINVLPPNSDYPDGYALNVVDGIIRCRYRGGRTVQKLLEPGRIYEMEIDLAATGMIFKKEHRIRLDISSSNYPRFDLNPNTGEPLALHKQTRVANNTLYHDREHPSYLLLPIVPAIE